MSCTRTIARLGLRELGRQQAHADLGGIYKMLLKVVTVPVAIKQAATLWKQYHDQGEANVDFDDAKPNQAALVITGYPEASRDFAEYNAGYIIGVLERTGAKDVTAAIDFSNPQAWRTLLRWR